MRPCSDKQHASVVSPEPILLPMAGSMRSHTPSSGELTRVRKQRGPDASPARLRSAAHVRQIRRVCTVPCSLPKLRAC